jgi:methyl-accepting chemotaxis protein
VLSTAFATLSGYRAALFARGLDVNVSDALGIALTVITIILVIAAIYVLRVLLKAIQRLLDAVEDVRSRLVPLLDKADITVDALNAELLRVDAIVTQAEEVGDAVSTASGIIRAPINSLASGVARVARSFRKP